MKKTKVALICLYILQFVSMSISIYLLLTGYQIEGYIIMCVLFLKFIIYGGIYRKNFFNDLKSYSKEIYDILYVKDGYTNSFLWFGYEVGLIGENTHKDRFVRKYLRIDTILALITILEGLLLIVLT